MKKIIVIDGISSFTGFHFANSLSTKYKVYGLISKKYNNYKELKKKRLDILLKNQNIKIYENIKFGDLKFFKILKKFKKIDLFCLHSSYTKNYNNDNKFSLKKAISSNLNNIEKFLDLMKLKGARINYSQSIFQSLYKKNVIEKNFSKYSISKDIVSLYLTFLCEKKRLLLSFFTIANPFGIYEEKRYTNYLIKTWNNNETVFVKTPYYFRDNIPIDYLNFFFLNHVNKVLISKRGIFNCPSYYKMTQLDFTKIFKKKYEQKVKKKVKIKINNNFNVEDYAQPLRRVGSKKIDFSKKINIFWEKYLSYYCKIYDI